MTAKNGKFFKIPILKGWNFSIVMIVFKIAYIFGTMFLFLELFWNWNVFFWILCIRGRGLRPIPESIKFGAKAISLVVCAENFFLNFDENIKNWIPTSHNKNHLLKNELGLKKALSRVKKIFLKFGNTIWNQNKI